MERIYLDNNATTIVDPLVREAMEPYYCEMYGNPNSLHNFGTAVHPCMRLAMDRIYQSLNAADQDDIVINSCATESNNTVLKGVFHDLIRLGPKKRIISSPVEHPCVKHTLDFLETLGAEVVLLPVNEDGLVDAAALKDCLDPDRTALVSVMWVNNETGLINPLAELAELCRENGVLFHTDAVQAVGKIPLDLKKVPVDFLSFSAHKFHGPKGVGGLFIRSGLKLTPLLHGGEQMGGKRAGTVNVAGLVGMGLAMEMAVAHLPFFNTEIRKLRDRLEDAILALPETRVVGRRSVRTANTILAGLRGIEGEAMLWDLNENGVAASTGSACASESLQANPVFRALGLDQALAHTAIRLSLSRFSTGVEIDRAAEVLSRAVKRLRDISSTFHCN